MRDDFALASFLARWSAVVRYDLSASESSTTTLAALMEMASMEDRTRWDKLVLGYAEPRGASWLRAAIAAQYLKQDPENIVCCAGAQEAVSCVTQALLRPGDHAVVVVPIYQPAEYSVTSIGAVTGVALRREGAWQIDVEAVAAAIRPETRLILMNFPNSPTGALLDWSTLSALVDLCRHHGLWLVNDEVYRSSVAPSGLVPQIADVYERGVSINAVSKGFGLPGLRVGWIACQDRSLFPGVMLAKSSISSCLAAPCEILAHIALGAREQILGRNRALCDANRSLLQSFLWRHPELFEAPPLTSGAFAFPRYRGSDKADQFAAGLAADAGVLVLPAGLWSTPLAAIPMDYLRIGLGGAPLGPALEAMDNYLAARVEGRKPSIRISIRRSALACQPGLVLP